MRRPLRPLLGTLVALMLLGSATAEGEAPTEAPAFSVLANATVSCSAAWPSTTVGCWLEKPLIVLGGLELAIGVDAQAAFKGTWDDAHLAPYVIAAVYFDAWSVWMEARLPELSGIPVLGTSDTLRLGFTYRIPP